MNTYITLFRGINVCGHNKLPMRDLVEILANLDLENIETYIQSGNVIFESEEADSAALSDIIRNALIQSHGFEPEVIILTKEELETAIETNPYPDAEGKPQSLHVYFLGAEPKNPNMEKLRDKKLDNEKFTLKGKVFYLYAPDGVGRSKLAAGVEKALGVTVTARNWRSVSKIMSMANR